MWIALQYGRKSRSCGPPASPFKKNDEISCKSERSREDGEAAMGMGATNTMDRVAASIGAIGDVPLSFTPCTGRLLRGSSPVLAGSSGDRPIRHTREFFRLPQGYYALETIFLLLAFMALSRIKTIESLRYCAPGEWGKLLGLDRIPEVRTAWEDQDAVDRCREVGRTAMLRMDGSRSEQYRDALCGRPCPGISWTQNSAPPPLHCPSTSVPAC